MVFGTPELALTKVTVVALNLVYNIQIEHHTRSEHCSGSLYCLVMAS